MTEYKSEYIHHLNGKNTSEYRIIYFGLVRKYHQSQIIELPSGLRKSICHFENNVIQNGLDIRFNYQ